MIVAILGDMHIGDGPRAEETRRVHAWIADFLHDRRPDAICCAGDVFDRRSTPGERLVAADLFLRLAEVAPVLGCAGNHDVPGDLLVFNRCGRPGGPRIVFHEEPAVEVVGDVAVALLPWHRAAPPVEVLALATVAERDDAERELHRARLRALGAALTARHAARSILCGHAQLRESPVRIGQPERRGRDFVLGLDDLALVGADAYALGHVHASDEHRIGDRPVIVPGSTTRRTFGELEKKYIALFHVVGTAVSVEWVELPVRPMLACAVAWEEVEPGRWGWAGDVESLAAGAQGADIRLTLRVPEAQRALARRAAPDLERLLATAGAAGVTCAEEMVAITRARAPEIARTPSLREKLAIALAQRECPPTDPQHARVLALFDEKVAPGAALSAAVAPVFESVRLAGVGVFAEEVVLDLGALPGPLVAVVGEPGAGKSTLLEAFPGAVHPKRETPTRGSFDALADGHGKGSFVEVTFSASAAQGRSSYRVRYEPNRERAFLWRDGEEVRLDGKVSKVGAWLAEHVVEPEVVTSALFLGQRSEGLIDANGAERRAGLLRAIGIAEIERLAEATRRIARDATAALDRNTAAADALAPGAGRLVGAEARVDAAAAARVRLAETHAAAADAVTAARASFTTFSAREVERATVGAAHVAATVAVAGARSAVAATTERRAAALTLLDGADQIRVRAARARVLDVEIAAASANVAGLVAGAQGAAAAEIAAGAAVDVERERWKAARAASAAAEARLQGREAVQAAVVALPGLHHAATAAEEALSVAIEAARVARAGAAGVTEQRIGSLRGALGEVVTARRILSARAAAAGALRADAAVAEGAVAQDRIAALDAAEVDARRHLAAAQARLQSAERVAAGADAIAAAEQAHAEAIAALAAAQRAGEAAKGKEAEAIRASAEASTRASEAQERLRALRAEREGLGPAVEQEAGLAGVAARVAELDARLGAAQEEVERALAAAVALAPVPDPLPAVDVGAAEADLDRATRGLSAADAEIATATASREAAADAARRQAELLAVRASLEEAVADAGVLADALGIGGVVSLEIDAAGPAITANMNRLLHGAYGPRFTAEVNATRPSKDGRRTIDECTIAVTDTTSARSTPRDVRSFSGGERAILASAFHFALCHFICESRGVVAPTIFADEPGSAMGDQIGAWVDMVRAGARMVGARHMVVVTHSPLVVDAADSVVRVEGGRVVVER